MCARCATHRNRLAQMLCAGLFACILLPRCAAQVAGLGSLAVFDIATSARAAGLGLDYLAVGGSDVSAGVDNPSLLLPCASRTATLTFVPMFDGSNAGLLGYAHSLPRWGTLGASFRFVNYGRFHGYDEEETYTGDFGASDHCLALGYGLRLADRFSLGVNVKPVLSQYETYRAFALLFDLAVAYLADSSGLAATLMARNAGTQVMAFDQTVERLPFELSAQLSYKLRNAPFRFYLGAAELQRWNLRYKDPLSPTVQSDPFTGEVNEEPAFKSFMDNLMRHVLVGVELNIGSAFMARVGYSYRQNAEMRGYDAFNLSGFSFGVGLHIKHFDFAYSRRDYHLAQALNYITLTYRF